MAAHSTLTSQFANLSDFIECLILDRWKGATKLVGHKWIVETENIHGMRKTRITYTNTYAHITFVNASTMPWAI